MQNLKGRCHILISQSGWHIMSGSGESDEAGWMDECQFPRVTVTKYPKVGTSKQQKFILISGSQKSDMLSLKPTEENPPSFPPGI